MSDNSVGIRLIFGKFGAGKGTLNTMFAVEEMKDKQRYESCLSSIEGLELEFQRNFRKPPQEHVVYANYDIKYKGFERYEFDPDKFMLPNKDFEFNMFPPFACFHIEEGHSGALNSYEWSKFPKPMLLAYSRVRHPHYLFNIDFQYINHLNNSIREFAFEYITPVSIKNEFNCLNQLIKTSVQTGVFYSYDKAFEYEKTKDVNLFEDIRVYTFNGNIYNCYDSYGKYKEFFDVSSKIDFSYEEIKRGN